jgi:hypothetical protein
MALVNYRKRTRKAVHTCVDTRRVGDEGTIDAKPASASLLAGILFEDVNRYSPSSDANCRGQSGE